MSISLEMLKKYAGNDRYWNNTFNRKKISKIRKRIEKIDKKPFPLDKWFTRTIISLGIGVFSFVILIDLIKLING